jgi:membrane fusion protein (multidrug efflux system)
MRNGKAMPSNVEIGLRTEDRIQITAGLAPGDTVITSGILQLRPGLDVTVSGFEAS